MSEKPMEMMLRMRDRDALASALRKLRKAAGNKHALLCDTGLNAGMYALELGGRVYLTGDECDALGVSR